jgi:DNA-binding transcriptional MerR regulator
MAALPQMTLNFTTAISPPAEESPTEPESPAVNVGVRIKKLKGEDPPVAEQPQVKPVPKPKSSRGRKSISQVAAEADLINIPEDEELFRKQYYTMGEVAGMFRVNQSLLRFWETEFSVIQPKKNKKGDRYFRPEDVKNLHLIYHLLRQRKYTIEGAKDFLKNNRKAEQRFELIRNLEQIRNFLLELKTQL